MRGFNRVPAGAVAAPQIQTFGSSGLAFDSTRFDTFSVKAGVDSYKFFANGQGVKTAALTNMEDDGQFPSGVAFLIQQVGIRYSLFVGGSVNANETLETLRKFIAQSTLTVNVTGFQNMGQFPAVEFGSTTVVSAATAGNSTLYSVEPQWKALRSPIPLQPRALFSFTYSQATAPSGTPGTSANDTYGSQTAALDTADVQLRIQVLIKGIETRRGA